MENIKRIIKKRWVRNMLIVIIIIFVIMTIVGILFKDDGSLGGFTSQEGEEEYKKLYDEAMVELPKPIHEENISTEFGNVKLYKFGTKGTENQTPILLLPGKSAATPMWEANLKDFTKERPIYTIDLIGEPGLSTESKRIMTTQDQAAWLIELINQLPEKRIHVLGLSFGGWNATNLVLHDSRKIESVILVEPVYVFDAIPLKMVLASIPASVPIVPKSIRDKMLSYISGGADVEDDGGITGKLIESGMSNFKSKLPMPELITEKQLQSIDVPILGILAGKSTMHNFKDALECGENNLTNSMSKMAVFKNASHAINGEYPDELADEVSDFCRYVEVKKAK